MEGKEKSDSASAELTSVARTMAHLAVELEALDRAAPAAQLYEAFIVALEKVYPHSAL